MSEALLEVLESIVSSDSIYRDEPMSKHTTFRTGGVAKWFVEVENKEQLLKLIPYLHTTGQDYFILGNGSNLLVSDKGYDGIVISLMKLKEIKAEGNKITAGAGVLLSQLAALAAENSLTGLEFASGIPGSVGGATVMNAGAYGGEMKQIVESVVVVSKEGEFLTFDNDTMEFSYRHSIIKDYPFTVVEVTFVLETGVKQDIVSKMQELGQQRRQKQPLEYASAGSTFKRPEGYFAGKLIMDAGLRGFRIGGAQVAEKHCGFIINVGNASSQDIWDLICEIREIVKNKFHVELEPEVICLGEF